MYASRDVSYKRLSEILLGDTTEAWIDRLTEHGVWCAPVQSYDDIERDPQVVHRGLFRDVPVGDGQDAIFRTVGSPFTFSEAPLSGWAGCACAGQHTGEFFPAGGGHTDSDATG